MSELLESSIALQNSIAIAIAALSVLGLLRSWTRSKSVWNSLFKKSSTIVSFIILVVFFSIGILDSISWRDPVLDQSGRPQINEQGEAILSSRALSMLDRLCTDMRTQVERTYSAPLARHQFTKDLEQQADGKKAWVQKDLKYPGSHWLGTDIVGRDVLYMCLKSIRTALIIGGFTTLISIPIALVLGLLAGYFGKRIDVTVQFITSTIGSVPFILIAAAYILLYGASIFNLCVIMGLTGWTSLCRLIRGEVLKVRELDFVQGARALGASHSRVMFKYIVPNIFHLVIISSVLGFSGLVLSESVLSYLKIGVGQNTYSWGNMINQANLELSREPVIWWNLIGAFSFMMLLILPTNIFGDALRDALDPKTRGRQS